MLPNINYNYNYNYIPKYSQSVPNTSVRQNFYTTAPYALMPMYLTNPINPTLVNPKITGNYAYLGTIKTPFGDDIYTYMLKSGQRVAILPREGTTILKTFVDSGSMNENDRIRGISHFIEHNLFNGSEKLAPGQFFKDVTKMGASTNASTDYAQTDYYISSGIMDIKDFKQAAMMHADMILRPKFYDEMLEKEKGPVTSEISMINDDVTTVAANEVVRNLFQIKSESKNLVAGSIETVNNLGRDDVVDYWSKHYTPDSLYTVVVGDFDPAETIEILAKEFNQNARVRSNDVTKETLTPIDKSVRIDLKSPVTNSTNVIMGFAAPPSNNLKDSIALEALDVLLEGNSDSRLSKALSGINSYSYLSMQKVGLKKDDPQALFVQINTPAQGEQKAIDAFYDVILNLQNNPPSEYEMNTIKSTLSKALAMNFESAESICETIGSGYLDGNLPDISQMQNIINSLTPYDIVSAAQKYVDLNKVSMAVVHPATVSDEQIYNNYQKSKFLTKTSYSPSSSISFTSRKIDTSGVEEYKLQNNTHIVLNNSDKSDICYINWDLNAINAMPKNLAVPYILTELLNSGSALRQKEQLSMDVNSKGISYDFDSNGFKISANADCMVQNLPETLELLKEVMYHPNFSQEDFEAAKAKVENYFKSVDKDGSDNMLVQLYPGYFGSPKEILKGLKNMSLNDVIKHYNDMLNMSSSNFVITAPFEKYPELKSESMAKISNSPVVFKDFVPKFTSVYRPNKTTKVVVDTAELNQAQIYKTYSFKMSGNIKDEVKFELLNEILGGSPASRLFQDLREKQKLAYRVSSQVQSFEDTGILTMFIMSTTDDKAQNDIKYDNLQKSLDGFDAHVQKLLNEPVTQEELDCAKMQLKQRIAKQTELPSSETSLLAMNMTQPYGIKRIDEYVKAIDLITIDDITQAAKHIFKNKPTISILASPDTIENQTDYIQTLGEVVQAA